MPISAIALRLTPATVGRTAGLPACRSCRNLALILRPRSPPATRTAMFAEGWYIGSSKYCSKMLTITRVRDIAADKVEQLERTHSKPGRLLHQQIDLARACNALRHDAQRLRPIGAAGVIDDKPRRVGRDDRMFVDALHEADQRLDQCRIAAQAADHLDQPHQWRRIEEMQAANAFRPSRNRRRLSVTDSEDVLVASTASGARRFSSCAEQLALGVEVFDDRFDNDAGPLRLVEGTDRLQTVRARPCLSAAVIRSLAPDLQGPLSIAAIASFTAPSRGIEQQRGEAGLRAHLCDAAPHGAGAEYAQRSDPALKDQSPPVTALRTSAFVFP